MCVCDGVYLCPVCPGGLSRQGLDPVAVLRRGPTVVLGVGSAGGAAMLAEEGELNTIISQLNNVFHRTECKYNIYIHTHTTQN